MIKKLIVSYIHKKYGIYNIKSWNDDAGVVEFWKETTVYNTRFIHRWAYGDETYKIERIKK